MLASAKKGKLVAARANAEQSLPRLLRDGKTVTHGLTDRQAKEWAQAMKAFASPTPILVTRTQMLGWISVTAVIDPEWLAHARNEAKAIENEWRMARNGFAAIDPDNPPLPGPDDVPLFQLDEA